MTTVLHLTASDWLGLLTHFLTMSVLAVGGIVSTIPDMHRNLVDQQRWLSDHQFNASIALTQAAPGPNLLFIPVLGWQVGLNAAGGTGAGLWAWVYATLGMTLSLVGIMLPSTTLTFMASRWVQRNRERTVVRAFKQGLAPLVVALLMSTGWIMTANQGADLSRWPLWLLTAGAALLVWRTRVHLLWLLGAGALLGWLGWV